MSLKGPKFTQEMRDAIVAACLDQGLSPRKARDAAARGELAGVPRFEMSEAYARDLRDRAVEDRACLPFDGIKDLNEQGLAIAVEIARDRLRVIRRGQAKRRDRAGFDPLEVDRLAAVLKRCQKEQAKPSSTSPEPDKDDTSERERKALERRLKQQTEPSGDTPLTGNEAGTPATSGNGTAAAQHTAAEGRRQA